MAASNSSGSLSGFVESRGLSAGTGGALPDDGGLLGRAGLEINGAGNGELADGLDGRIVHCTFETRSDDTTTTHRRTAVVVRVPEAMGYAPYLLIGGGIGPSTEAVESRRFEPAEGVVVMADRGINEGWLHELFSPAFSEWLQRSPGDFGAEYVAGTLIVARDTHITEGGKLTNLCTDAARIAGALREEALEASEAGGGKAAAAAAPKPNDLIAAKLIGELEMAGPPAHVESALASSRSLAKHDGWVWGRTVKLTILWMLAINVIGGGIYGLLLTVGDPLVNVLVYQVFLLILVGTLTFRSVTGSVAKIASEEAFYQGYAKANGLTAVEPLQFAAEHAEADLPGKPLRVFEGSIGGGPGALMLTGAGRERGDRIALVRGPRGPTAVTELDVSAPGVSAAALDELTQTLVLDLETAPQPVE